MAQRELPPHGPRRAGLPQRVLQALLPDLAQECALASADILSMSVHIRIQVLSPGYVSFRQMRALVSPFPPVGSMAALSEPCGSPPSSVLWGRKTAPPSFLAPFGRPSGTSLPPATALREEMASSLRFLGNPCGNMPRARDSGDPGTTSLYRSLPDAAFRLVNGVGIATRLDFGAESSRPTSSLCTLRTHQSPGEWQHSLLTCLLDFGQAGVAPAGLQ
jgi:hypothetical protein